MKNEKQKRGWLVGYLTQLAMTCNLDKLEHVNETITQDLGNMGIITSIPIGARITLTFTIGDVP